METRAFSFDLPNELIAQHPVQRRDNSRLLLLDKQSGEISHHHVTDLPTLLPPESVMVFNRSKVRKARLYARAAAGGNEREFLLIARRENAPDDQWTAMTKRVRRLKPGTTLSFPAGVDATVVSAKGELVTLQFAPPLTEEYFEHHGHVPLPPYIRRKDEPDDESRYQTIYATTPGSVAAPTAGLHFTEELLAKLRERVELEWVELHVGLGTFLPVRARNIEEHSMHSERFSIDSATATRLTDALRDRRPIVAVGTTSVRTLEASLNEHGQFVPGAGETNIFIRPGYSFGAVSGLFTNFHTPESTLLMLVAAFAGLSRVLEAYQEAIALRYRFFSYGDAMLIR